MTVSFIPEGYTSVTPYMVIRGAAEAIDFYKRAFNATELFRMPGPEGKVGHAEIRIGNACIMLADEVPDHPSALQLGGSPISLLIYTEDVDSLFQQAIAAGGKSIREPVNMFYGDRMSVLTDPFGHQWSIATHIEDPTPEQIRERMAAMGATHG